VIGWFRRQGFLAAQAATDRLAWWHGGFSVDASVRIPLVALDVPSYFQSLKHLFHRAAEVAPASHL
jgi:hypothetical protein